MTPEREEALRQARFVDNSGEAWCGSAIAVMLARALIAAEAELQEREKPVEVSRVGFCASLACKRGVCTCGDFVNDFQNYCPNCGIRLEWS